jgi:DNA mismatch endonuclease (patch repair protein)
MAEAHRGYVMPEEQKRKIGKSCKGKTLGRKKTPEHVEKMRAAMLAKGDDHSSKRQDVRCKLSLQYGGHAHRQTEPEALMHNALDKRSWRYVGSGLLRDGRVNPHYEMRKRLPVSADFVCFSTRTLIFVDGCYWHECPQHGTGAFPDKRSKDNSLRQYAVECGWNVVSIWEHDVRTDAVAAARRLKAGGESGRDC